MIDEVIKDKFGYLFGEVFSGCDNMFMTIEGRRIYLPNEIESPSREGSWSCDQL